MKIFRIAFIFLLTIVFLLSGCVHSRVTRDFGLPAISRKIEKVPKAPDVAMRQIFQQQTQGAFDPLTRDQRIQTMQARLKLNPQDSAARLELAALYESYGFNDDAFDQYMQVLNADPSSEAAALGLSRVSRAAGHAAEGLPLVEAFAAIHPSADSWNEVGLLYDAVGNLKSGEIAFRNSLLQDESSDRMHNNLGYNLLLQNDTRAAELEFRRALELNPKSATTRNNLGVVLARHADLAGALEQFEAAADAATAHNNLAVVLLELGRYEDSRQELVKALAIRHYFAPALANFKLVQDRIRLQAESQKANGSALQAEAGQSK
jgi:Flp pilus assembly protein TadD